MGLNVMVYRGPLGDCTNEGISSKATSLCLVNVSGPSEPSSDSPPALLQNHQPGILRIIPAYKGGDGQWRAIPLHWMNGGNLATTSDSRFTDACERLTGGSRFYGGVYIHDRHE